MVVVNPDGYDYSLKVHPKIEKASALIFKLV